jgi:uncharacterized DUF497 family protein
MEEGPWPDESGCSHTSITPEKSLPLASGEKNFRTGPPAVGTVPWGGSWRRIVPLDSSEIIAYMQLHDYNYNMDFVRDEAKDMANLRKHGISFADARHVFDDPLAITRMYHHESEPRWQILGHWGSMILILVVYTIERLMGMTRSA